MNVHAQGLDTLPYQSGFGNEFASEALPGALPVGQNSPHKVPNCYQELPLPFRARKPGVPGSTGFARRLTIQNTSALTGSWRMAASVK